MNNQQYIDSVKQMMDNQDRYFNWFMVILSVMLVFFGYIQNKLSDRQIKQIKESTELEIAKEFEKKFNESNKEISKLREEIALLEFDIERFKRNNLLNEYRNLDFDLQVAENAGNILEQIEPLIHKYPYVSKDEQSLRNQVYLYQKIYVMLISNPHQAQIAKSDQRLIRAAIETLELCDKQFAEFGEDVKWIKLSIEELKKYENN